MALPQCDPDLSGEPEAMHAPGRGELSTAEGEQILDSVVYILM